MADDFLPLPSRVLEYQHPANLDPSGETEPTPVRLPGRSQLIRVVA